MQSFGGDEEVTASMSVRVAHLRSMLHLINVPGSALLTEASKSPATIVVEDLRRT